MAEKRPSKKSKRKASGKGKPRRTNPPATPSEPADDDLPPLHSMERILAMTHGPAMGPDPLVDAQDLIYEAWESPPQRATFLARRALEISEDCADAYCILARSAESLTQATQLYREGVAAGERSIGPEAFDEDVGYFWGLLETRPYMRARAGLASSLWAAGEQAEAVAHYQDMLRLNSRDNLGLRYVLLGCLLQMQAWGDAEKLYAEYEDDGMATWAYSRALLDFQRTGDSEVAREALLRAMSQNPYVPAYLRGEAELPPTLPAHHGLGDVNEAILYVAAHQPAWLIVPGALGWLRDATS